MIPPAESMIRCAAVWGGRLLVMTRKELIQLFRDLPIVLFFIYSFTLAVFIAGNGLRSQLHNAGLMVYDADHSFSSRDLIHRFQQPFFRLDGELSRSDESLRLMDRGTVMAVLEIPPRFHEQIMAGEQAAVQLLVDTTNAPQGLSAAGYAARIVGQFGQDALLARIGGTAHTAETLPVVISEHRVWYNADQNEAWFESISHLLRTITIFAILLPATAMVREKERGTIEQLLVSPLTPALIMLPKVLAMTLVILGMTAIALFGVMQPAFGVPIRGSVALLFAMTALFTFTTAGMGLFAATVARNQAQVGLMTLLMVAPILMLSGITAPMEALPEWIGTLMLLSPLRYFIDIAYSILLKGVGLYVLWPQVAAMVALGGALFGFGMWRFRRQFQ
ncbi:MAG: ABC transporter permease [Nitrospira sp.]